MLANSTRVFLNRKQLAEALGVSPRHISTMMAARQIPVLRLAPQIVRFDLAKVREALTAFEQPAIGGRA